MNKQVDMCYIMFEAKPLPDNPESEDCGGAYINVWVNSEDSSFAMERANNYIRNDDSIAQSTSFVEDWPYLFIKLKNVESINTWGYKSLDISRTIGKSEYTEAEGKKILAISDVYGGEVQVVFTGSSSFLALNKEKIILKINAFIE